ncbi:hypothetical protein KJ991_02970 [Patescibacteria group bacterium]|nr:hypothetical protein [Patescibacteria group bacterium]MBU4057602.1 hypothetical protein [Patescibacteria group bacterium]MBU4115632.1 hypothetical protein [Patescibacteria group bacterium]
MLKTLKEHKEKNSLHHAYLIEGDSDVVVGQICKFIEIDLNFKIQGNPDFWNERYNTFGIDDARKIKEIQTKKSFGDKKIFILSCSSITVEAQNSLLKLFEEPSSGTHFFIIADSSEIFLPTLKSRMLIIKNADQRGFTLLNPASQEFAGGKLFNRASADSCGLNPSTTELCSGYGAGPHTKIFDVGAGADKKKDNISFVEKFLKTSKSKRLKMIKDIIDEKDLPAQAGKEKAILFLNNLEIVLREKIDFSSKEQTDALREIIKCRNYLNDRAPSVKLILEHIALIVPEQ